MNDDRTPVPSGTGPTSRPLGVTSLDATRDRLTRANPGWRIFRNRGRLNASRPATTVYGWLTAHLRAEMQACQPATGESLVISAAERARFQQLQALEDAIAYRRARLAEPCPDCGVARCDDHATDANLIAAYQRAAVAC
jgi:hypothetical protein